MEITFVIFLLLTIYSYALYPPLLWVLQVFLRRPWAKGSMQHPVSMIVSVYNEESVIQEKIENALSLKYPAELLEIIISSDGSTDKTHEIVSRYDDPRVVLKRFERVGKTECLNRVVPEAKGDIVLFTDANAMFPPDLLEQVSGNFVDPDVGLVTGWTKYLKAGGGEDVTGAYSKLEKITKRWESLVCSCVGADGAVFAIRKSLFRPLDVGDINDFIIPLNVVGQGKRVVLDPEVYCREEAADDEEKAYGRQVRITTRTLWAIRRNLGFLNFREFGVFSFFLLSHKVLRLAAPFFFILAFVLNIFLVGQSWVYGITFTCFVLFLGIGFLGLFGFVKGSVASICKFFLLTLSAQFVGWMRMAAGIKDTTWTPMR